MSWVSLILPIFCCFVLVYGLIKKIDVFKKELRACMVHGNYEIDERFLESIKSLNSLPTFKLCMSKNYNEVCQVLNDFLGDYS